MKGTNEKSAINQLNATENVIYVIPKNVGPHERAKQ
jgi:hypothetical protein